MSNKFRVAFMETLSRSCRIPGLPIRHEQRSYSSLSRSQQRVIGGSRNVGTAGTGIVHESTDCSGNSGHEDNSKQFTSLVNQLKIDTIQNNINKKNEDIGRLDILSNEVRQKNDVCLKNSRKYTTVNVDESGKKWWHLLKWFPGLKSLKFSRRNTYTIPENQILKRPEEISMTLWNETNQQRPV